MILKAKKRDLYKIASLHKNLIRGASSSMFGTEFVYNLYCQLLNDQESGVWALTKGKDIVGFISLSKNMHKTSKVINKNFTVSDYGRVLSVLLSDAKATIKFIKRLIFDLKLLRNIHKYPNIISIGVSKKYQGAGYGKKLMFFADRYFKKNSINTYFVDTEASNKGAVSFYKSLGFKEYLSAYSNVCFKKTL